MGKNLGVWRKPNYFPHGTGISYVLWVHGAGFGNDIDFDADPDLQ
jgi:hypothetical protein